VAAANCVMELLSFCSNGEAALCLCTLYLEIHVQGHDVYSMNKTGESAENVHIWGKCGKLNLQLLSSPVLESKSLITTDSVGLKKCALLLERTVQAAAQLPCFRVKNR
jgi:hypothetical protein